MQFQTFKTSETMFYLTLCFEIFEYCFDCDFRKIWKEEFVFDLFFCDVATTKNTIICNPCMHSNDGEASLFNLAF